MISLLMTKILALKKIGLKILQKNILKNNYLSNKLNQKETNLKPKVLKSTNNVIKNQFKDELIFLYAYGINNQDLKSIINQILKQTNLNQLESNLTLQISDSIKDFEAGINIYENLQIDSNDRFQHVLPYYSFYSDYYPKKIDYGYFSFSSDGNNNSI